ncbi:MAG: sodium:proton exchanger [Alicyclobacillus sp. RIFOXYA1_FULL_53_8]|nr:MAG: sodium:proton exchanger [Alicyclobacillus sp. RIFOXYA1_FULL_53_8]
MRMGISMVLALAMILFGAELFTNAVEWFGRKLGLGQGAVGSVLAALGTALPETAVPVTAIVLGGGSSAAQEVWIGGILGAPFLLVTLGSLVMATALLLSTRVRNGVYLDVHPRSFHRDMVFFLLAYAVTLLVGSIQSDLVHRWAPWVLVALYCLFVVFTVRDKDAIVTETHLKPLYMQRRDGPPTLGAVLLQLLFALVLIVGGAQLLSVGVEHLAGILNWPPFVLSVLLIPLATELPETLNSVVWIRQGKDALALGNITGAMVFQSTLVPALGIWLTPWRLTPEALFTGSLTLAAASLIFGVFRLRGRMSPGVLMAASLLYWVLPLQTLAVHYEIEGLYWIGPVIGLLVLVLLMRTGRQTRSA